MSGRGWVLVLLAVFGLVAAIVLFAAPAGGRRSITDRTPRGYRAAYAYLEATGGDVRAWESPFDELRALQDATLVTAWPLSRGFQGTDASGDNDAADLALWVRKGGRAVLLLDLSTENIPPVALVEGAFKGLLVKDDPLPPWSWADWRVWATARRTATLSGADLPAGTLALADPQWKLTCPDTAEVLAADPTGWDRVCRFPFGKGEVVLISDATVWQNDHLGRADNLALLDALLGGHTVRFDEWHHAASVVTSTVPSFVPALFALHFGALWLVGILSLAHRFGDRLPPPRLAGPSMARALHALATLHRGSGHAASATTRLYILARARTDRRGLDPGVLPAPPVAPSDARFTAWAARIAAAQRDHRF